MKKLQENDLLIFTDLQPNGEPKEGSEYIHVKQANLSVNLSETRRESFGKMVLTNIGLSIRVNNYRQIGDVCKKRQVPFLEQESILVEGEFCLEGSRIGRLFWADETCYVVCKTASHLIFGEARVFALNVGSSDTQCIESQLDFELKFTPMFGNISTKTPIISTSEFNCLNEISELTGFM